MLLCKAALQVWENNEAGTEVFPVPNTNVPLTQPGQLQRSKVLHIAAFVALPMLNHVLPFLFHEDGQTLSSC